jgi:hypothetical protein
MRSTPAVTTYGQIARVLGGQQSALLGRRYWRGTVAAIDGIYPGPYRVQVIRNGENIPDSKWYPVPGHVAVGIGDDVVMVNLDQGSAVVSHQVSSAGQAPASRVGRGAPQAVSGAPTGGTWVQGDLYVDANSVIWVCQVGGTPGTWGMAAGWYHWSQYVVGPGGSIDTSSNPGGDIPLPSGYRHAKVFWSAVDTSANTTAQFGGMQLAIGGGAIDTAANYAWTDFSNANGGAVGPAGANPDAAWKAFSITGGGTGANWMSHGEITLLDYSNGGQTAKAFWDTVQINNGTIIRRSGSGYYFGGTGAVSKLHFFATAGGGAIMAAGTYFDLYVSA